MQLSNLYKLGIAAQAFSGSNVLRTPEVDCPIWHGELPSGVRKAVFKTASSAYYVDSQICIGIL
jgi:hypothetical protein